MSAETIPTPVDVLAERSKQQLRIEWSDGHVSTYDWRYLRGHCPCAGCQGHGGPHVFHEVEGAGAELSAMNLVGSYAILLAYGDGHDSGIYSYRFLREICPCEDHGGPGYSPGQI